MGRKTIFNCKQRSDITLSYSHFSIGQVSEIVCHLFKTLLSEQNFGIIAGRFREMSDRLSRLSGLTMKEINSLLKQKTEV